ncbi:FKBP-type peptidyl-prolyl cis-trans isomerase [Cecembia rubra]|uniref:Peptidyl-prolyl cis-trans isomerase n=1 Tax=Cecembia rubra TaxID=1485585 RepID=A0A2P8DXQ4_9BACT|nr:FKBP-type peptidyl-prolyl cis-trans isomerase [Cecembia rubra]PSL02009.1 FKBP-type peptidyl-prolyl isomerase-like protein [Cecembia rubra]
MQMRFSVWLIGVLFALNSCIQGVESDLEKAIERDDRLLKEFLQRNNIDAVETPLGYYYVREVSAATGNQIVNNDIVGIYYEIRTINGQLIEDYFDETKPPKIFAHSEGGLVPRAINFAAGLAKEGEILKLYVPSYLAYQDYTYQQLILPNSNLQIRVKYAKIYTVEEIKTLEDLAIQDYIAANELEGFQKTPEGLYLKIVSGGNTTGTVTAAGNVIGFTYGLFQMGDNQALAESSNTMSPIQISLGNPSNLQFLNLAFLGLRLNAEIEVFSPSHLAFGKTTQVIPFQIRRDLFQKSFIPQVARPFEPVYLKAKLVDIR